MRELADWAGLASGCEDLAELVVRSYRPNRIVAIARGGIFPGLLIAYALDIDRFDSIAVRYKDSARSEPSLESPLPTDVEGSRILLVEDFLLSGKSLLYAAAALRNAGATVRSAACGYSSAALVEPDFSLGTAAQPPVFPWEL